jgi:hypothetical protein
MPAATFDALVSEGMLHAGVEGISTRVGTRFKQWLRSQASLFLWPQCKREASGIALAIGIQKLVFGNGSGGITEEISRINDPMKIYTNGFDTLGDVRIQTDWSTNGAPVDNVVNNPTSNKGLPTMARVKTTVATPLVKGRWDVIFDRVADKAYLLEMSYYAIPADPAGAEPPWYPNDRTMEQACYVFALQHNKDDSAPAELKILATMVAQDRVAEGMKPGINDAPVRLDPKIYR